MSFIQPCFIRKNTPELQEKLENLGYKPFGMVELGFGLSTDELLAEYESFGDSALENILKVSGTEGYKKDIDCGTNEELFFALAALRDDTDKNQWIIDEANEGFGFEDSWMICDRDNMNDRCVYTSYRKASVKEIIERFK